MLLEHYTYSELDVPRIGARQDASEIGVGNVGSLVSRFEEWGIKEVEELCAKLRVNPLFDSCVLEEGHIETLPAWASEVRLRERVRRNCVRSSRFEGSCVEPVIERLPIAEHATL